MSSTKGKHKQQLQVEIEQVLSKVDELRASFQQHWDKLESGTPANREKTENLLRADLDKLKRLRKQIQTLMDLPEVATTRNKLKRCTDAIEADMRRHYILERESKTKQFSNVALNDENEKRAGPRASTQAWLDLCLTELNNRLEDLRSQLDGVQLQGSTKKNMKMAKVNVTDKLIIKLEEHKEQLEDVIAAYEEGYITHADIELYLKKSLDEVIRACKSGADIDITTVIYDDIADLIRTNKMCGSIESFDDLMTEHLDWTPSSAKSPGSGSKVGKEVQSRNDRGLTSMSPISGQDEADEIMFFETPRTNTEGDTEICSTQESPSKDKKDNQTVNIRQTLASKQISKSTKQGKSSSDIITSECIDGCNTPQAQAQPQALPPIKGGGPVHNTRVIRPVFQTASQLSYLRPSSFKDNTLLYTPAATLAAISLYSLRLPKPLMLCAKPHSYRDVVPDLSRSITLLSAQIGNEHQALNDIVTHNMVLEFRYAERPISKIWITLGAFSSERGKGKPYYTYNPGSSIMSKQQLIRLNNVRRAMTELRTKGRTVRKRDNQTPSLSDNNDTGSTSSFDLDVGGSDIAHFTAEDGFHVASSAISTSAATTGEGSVGHDSMAKNIPSGESVYPQMYSVRRFVNVPCALSSDHDLAEIKWFANRPSQALMWLVTNTENNRIRQLAAAGLQQQGYRYNSGQWSRETLQ